MYTFTFWCESGSFSVEHVSKVHYCTTTGIETVNGKQIQTHMFPIGKDLYLYGNDFSDSICGKIILHFEIREECNC